MDMNLDAPKQHGFTLIELMVVVAIVAILTTVAYPSYQDYITRGQLAEGTSTAADMRVRMEQYFQDNRTYVGAPICTTPPAAPAVKYFTFACAPTATTYTITATGTGTTTGFVYTVNQSNLRRTTGVKTGWGTAPLDCWVIRKGGGCS
jgi:type IV pilus assembly protein PilE